MSSQIRLELSTIGSQLQDGLQARVHDPLWLLARQWQLGEFKGDDAGTAASAQVVLESASLSRYLAGAWSNSNAAENYSPLALALETAVENEPIIAGQATNWKLAAETGAHLLRLLSAKGVSQTREVFLKSKYALKPTADSQRLSADDDSLRFLHVMAKRAIDGVQLYARTSPLRLRNAVAELFQEPPFDTVAAAVRTNIVEAITAWLSWYDELFQQSATKPAWIPERIEYEFSTAARTSAGEVVLSAPEYSEGNLDWFSFVARVGKSLGASASTSTSTAAFLPAPVTFRGMPSTRFWEFEDARVNFAQVEAAPHDLARVLLLKFALEYSNDWFVVPVELAIGSLCQVKSLILTNTFGERLLIEHTSQADGQNSPWRMFALTGDTQQLFLLPPVLGPSLQSTPLEEVLFLRDEMANVAWGIERVVAGAAGQPIDRFETDQARRAREQRAETGNQSATETAYRLGTTVPDNWIPLLPVRDGTAIRLKRGALPRFESNELESIFEPQGLVLEPGRELLLNDEEVPREGARVIRAYQYARWVDGSTLVWIGRRKEPGRGEGSSGLRFDIIDPLSI